jgi:hypothetical protein
MQKIKDEQSGVIHHLGLIILVVIVVGVAGFAGYRVYSESQADNEVATILSEDQDDDDVTADDLYELSEEQQVEAENVDNNDTDGEVNED